MLSCSLSEASDTSGSKYDNVLRLVSVSPGRAVPKVQEQAALSESSNILDNLAEDDDSGCSESGQYDSNDPDSAAVTPSH